MNNFPYTSVMIKPVGGKCNLKCKYCYYSLRKDEADISLSPKITVRFIKDFYHTAKQPVNVCFQGGEPLLAGKDYYRRVLGEIKKESLPVNFILQTNGTMIDSEYCKIFRENNMLIGISIDGMEDINNSTRGNSFERIMRGIYLLKDNNVEFNTITVIAKHNYHKIGEIYDFLKNEKCYYQQYITCFPADYSKECYLNNDELEMSLQSLFDLWKKDWEYIFIREFDDIIKCIAGFPPSDCILGKSCIGALTLSSDLSLYYCDVPSGENTYAGKYPMVLENIANENRFDTFINRKSHIPEICRKCDFLNICNCGCPEIRKDNIYYYCRAVKNFLSKNFLKFKDIAKQALTLNLKGGFLSNF